jgi:hypothetical protein
MVYKSFILLKSGFPIKSGPVLVPESPAPISPHPPTPHEVGAITSMINYGGRVGGASVHCMNRVARSKIGAAPPWSAAPISVSLIPRKMSDLGRGRHIFNELWLAVGSVLRSEKLFLGCLPRATVDGAKERGSF